MIIIYYSIGLQIVWSCNCFGVLWCLCKSATAIDAAAAAAVKVNQGAHHRRDILLLSISSYSYGVNVDDNNAYISWRTGRLFDSHQDDNVRSSFVECLRRWVCDAVLPTVDRASYLHHSADVDWRQRCWWRRLGESECWAISSVRRAASWRTCR